MGSRTETARAADRIRNRSAVFQALDGGTEFPFTEAVSLNVDSETQADVDALWARLADGEAPGRCGWPKERFRLSWQIVPRLTIA